MADYWISFRINDDANYERRYDALNDAIMSSASKYWAETTSFYLARSGLDIDALGRKLVSTLDTRVDLLIMREVGVNNARYAGTLKDQDYLEFFPNAKKL